jgi:sulfhydrogenase subunit beta (sulfur reductase)
MADQIILQAAKDDVLGGLDKALSAYQLAVLTRREGKVLFDVVHGSQEIELDYAPTVLSPKKFFFPQEEVFLEYTPEGAITPKIEATPLILFGIHPCEANALKIMDEAFAESHGDPNYLAKREAAVVICMDCREVCDENAFCYSVKTNYAEAGYDLMLHELDGDYAITVKTDKGKTFADAYWTTTAVDQTAFDEFQKAKQAAFSQYAPFKDLERLPELFRQNKKHPVWKEEGDRCLSCGSCIMVCPTCYCFDVADELALSLQQGQRIRRWDACMLSGFAQVATGENFRETAEDRLKHRINRKFEYLMEKHGQPVCVGCGRCVRACLAEISPRNIVEAITGEQT